MISFGWMSLLSANHLSLAPLGAGDLIDRAVRLYRRHLFVLIRTAAPPVIIGAAGWIVFSLSMDAPGAGGLGESILAGVGPESLSRNPSGSGRANSSHQGIESIVHVKVYN